MRALKARDYFEQVRDSARDMQAANSAIERMEADEGISAIRYDWSACGTPSDGMGAVRRKMDAELELRDRIDADKRDIDAALLLLYGDDSTLGIDKICGTIYADILCAHYIKLQTWGEIARALGCSVRWAMMQRDKALGLVDSVRNRQLTV